MFFLLLIWRWSGPNSKGLVIIILPSIMTILQLGWIPQLKSYHMILTLCMKSSLCWLNVAYNPCEVNYIFTGPLLDHPIVGATGWCRLIMTSRAGCLSVFLEDGSNLWKDDCLVCVYMAHMQRVTHRLGWWENLQESPVFDGKNHGFL